MLFNNKLLDQLNTVRDHFRATFEFDTLLTGQKEKY